MKAAVAVSMYTMLLIQTTSADQVFSGYLDYYLSKQGVIFQESDVRSLQVYSTASDKTAKPRNVFDWAGEVDGMPITFRLFDYSTEEAVAPGSVSFILNGKEYRFDGAHIFPGEIVGEIDGKSASLYVNRSYLCLEGTGLGSSGKAQRHRHVYLLAWTQKESESEFYKLPSLFASCRGIRQDADGKVLFPRVSFRYKVGLDVPVGVAFQESTFRAGGFEAVGREVQADFVELDDVYRFRVTGPSR